ncbi:MAG: tRNA (adenosine(37)-N6)-threonylcarbamoyltransferase complex transferase subunit TsaD [Elusimicrobia bacterium]|nr:tRNA (adenosine(37)-N6)-threonylcarbamoyltransferase complex transferase subunit TsaD [Elusimicrobiota bacterium]
MRILAFETTCDETSVCLLSGRRLLSNIVFSQIKLHRKYNGVVPELASRAHLEKIPYVLGRALLHAGYRKPFFKNGRLNGPEIDAVVFSRGPGLPGALLVSRMAGAAAAALTGAGFAGVNHLEGHFLAYEYRGKTLARKIKFPCIGLIASGGHTELWKADDYGRYTVLGRTRDDAAGEAFDKVAKLLGLGYPGGPAVEKAALTARPALFPKGPKCGAGGAAADFPRPYMDDSFDFSFSGLKTAVAYRLRDMLGADFYEKREKVSPDVAAGICLAFEEAVTDTLVHKTVKALKAYGLKRAVIGGGVAANARLRRKFSELAAKDGYEVGFAEKRYCTDNAAMIALCGAKRLERGRLCGSVDIAPDLAEVSWGKGF